MNASCRHERLDEAAQRFVLHHGNAQVADDTEAAGLGQAGDSFRHGDSVAFARMPRVDRQPHFHEPCAAARGAHLALAPMHAAGSVDHAHLLVLHGERRDAEFMERAQCGVPRARQGRRQPQAELREGGIALSDPTVPIGIEGRQRSKTVCGSPKIVQRREVAEELGTGFDQSVAVAVQHQQREARCDPSRGLRAAIAVEVEVHTGFLGDRGNALSGEIDRKHRGIPRVIAPRAVSGDDSVRKANST
ncbi:MAG: hypothetical protein IT530_02185 [Burkholderiales bacterium]|nr:hypothetical protein [Burkholderiales bacterium]